MAHNLAYFWSKNISCPRYVASKDIKKNSQAKIWKKRQGKNTKKNPQANVSEALCSGVYASDNTTDGGLVAQEVGGKVLQSTSCNVNIDRLISTYIFLN